MSNFYTNAFTEGSDVYVTGYANGKRYREKNRYRPYVFLPTTDANPKYRSIEGRALAKKAFPSIRDAKDFLKAHDDITNFPVYGMTTFLYPFLNDEFPGDVDYDPELIKIVTIDIEVESKDGFPDATVADKEVLSVCLRKNEQTLVLGLKPYVNTNPNVTYLKCRDETDLLYKFLQVWDSEEWGPDVVTGWYIDLFDIPYMFNRILRVLGDEQAKRMSPWRKVRFRDVTRGKSAAWNNNRTEVILELMGIASIDYMELYKKFSFSNEESWKLDHIAHVVLGEKKLSYSEYDGLHDLYERNFDLFIEYNVKDVDLVARMEDKLGFLRQVFAMAYDAKVNYNDVMTTTKPWDVIIHNYLMEKNIAVSPAGESSAEPFEGGYVKEPQVGGHDWVVSFDLTSLYPHIMMMWNISPETLLGRVKVPTIDELLSGAKMPPGEDIVAASGCVFSGSHVGFLAEIMDKKYGLRETFKKKAIEAKKRFQATGDKEAEKEASRFHNRQLALKIQLNSGYGALANQWFRWFDVRLAEAITITGQLAIQWVARDINLFMNTKLGTKGVDYVVASDTDSVYVRFGEYVKANMSGLEKIAIVDSLDAFCKDEVAKVIAWSYDRLKKLVRAPTQRLQMKRESIADRAIWTAKKRYAMHVYDVEGVRYPDGSVKTVGLETVRSSTPAVVREELKGLLKVVLTSDEESVQRRIADFRDRFKTLPFEEVAFPRGISGMEKYADAARIYSKGTPIQVRGALIYNRALEVSGLSNQYRPVRNGDKVKFSYLRVPNPLKEDVISFPDGAPSELVELIEPYVDHETQFTKTFLDPISHILASINWSATKRNTIMEFFS